MNGDLGKACGNCARLGHHHVNNIARMFKRNKRRGNRRHHHHGHAGPLRIGQCYKFRNRAFRDRVFRHRGFAMYLDPIRWGTTYRADSTFRVVPGRANSNGWISLQSVNYPDRFMRHSGYWMWVHHSRAHIEKLDGTFKVHNSPHARGYVRFESYNFRNFYIREHHKRLRIDRQRGGFF